MNVKDSKGREAEIQVGGRNRDDIQITSATYTDDGSDVPDNEVEHIQNAYSADIDAEWYENKIGLAEAYAEGDR